MPATLAHLQLQPDPEPPEASALDDAGAGEPMVGATVSAEAGDPEQTGEQAALRKVTLYHFPTSLSSQQVRLALAEKGVVWEDRVVNIGPAHEQYEPWYAKLNPKLVVPTLEVEGTIVNDTVDIIRFIDQAFPGPSLLPRDPAQREEVLEWVGRQDRFPLRELSFSRAKGLVRWFERWTLDQRRKRLRKLQKKHPELRELYLGKLEQLEQFAAAVKDRALGDQLINEVEDLLDEFEERLQDRDWLAGDEYTLADLVWTVTLARLDHIGFGRSLGERRRPRVADWYRRLRERASWGVGIRRLSAGQWLRFYGPAVAKTFAVAWVVKWAVLTPLIYWLASVLNCSG